MSLTDSFFDIENNDKIKKRIWEIWHISKGAVTYKSKGMIYERLLYSSKYLNKEFPKISRTVFYKYLDRNIQ